MDIHTVKAVTYCGDVGSELSGVEWRCGVGSVNKAVVSGEAQATHVVAAIVVQSLGAFGIPAENELAIIYALFGSVDGYSDPQMLLRNSYIGRTMAGHGNFVELKPRYRQHQGCGLRFRMATQKASEKRSRYRIL